MRGQLVGQQVRVGGHDRVADLDRPAVDVVSGAHQPEHRHPGRQGEQAQCRRCGQEYASLMHVEDLITVEQQLGYRYEMPDSPVEHYQRICPRCRRALLGLAQGALWMTG